MLKDINQHQSKLVTNQLLLSSIADGISQEIVKTLNMQSAACVLNFTWNVLNF